MFKLSKKVEDTLSARIEYIEKKKGKCSPKALVDDARPKSSPIHEYFEWNNTVAGEKYRISQANFYLRKIKIIIEEVEVRRFMPLTKNRGILPRGYVSTTRIIGNEERMQNMLEIALEELKAFQEKYAILVDLCKEVDSIINKMSKKSKRI